MHDSLIDNMLPKVVYLYKFNNLTGKILKRIHGCRYVLRTKQATFKLWQAQQINTI